MNMRLYELKSETVIYFEMKLSALTSNKPSSYYEQTSDYIIKWTLIKTTE